LLAALNDEFTLGAANDGEELRLTTVVTGTYDGTSGEFNFAYAAASTDAGMARTRPAILRIGEGLENLPLGSLRRAVLRAEHSIERGRHDPGILGWGDEAHSPAGEQLTHLGFLALAEETLLGMEEPVTFAGVFAKIAGWRAGAIAGRRSWRTTLRF